MNANKKQEFNPAEIAYLEAKAAKLTLMRRLEQVKHDIGKAHLQVAVASAKLNMNQTLKCDVYLAQSGGDISE